LQHTQPEERLAEIFSRSEFLPVLKAIRALDLPDWWLAGGAVRNTVWRYLFPDRCQLGIKDFDIAFFDRNGIREQELAAKQQLTEQFPQLLFDVKNQASFGVWREWHFNFTSTEDGIAHWLHTATATGIRLSNSDVIEIFAPYGLSDLFAGIVRPTPYCVEAKAAELKGADLMAKCPALTARPD